MNRKKGSRASRPAKQFDRRLQILTLLATILCAIVNAGAVVWGAYVTASHSAAANDPIPHTKATERVDVTPRESWPVPARRETLATPQWSLLSGPMDSHGIGVMERIAIATTDAGRFLALAPVTPEGQTGVGLGTTSTSRWYPLGVALGVLIAGVLWICISAMFWRLTISGIRRLRQKNGPQPGAMRIAIGFIGVVVLSALSLVIGVGVFSGYLGMAG